MSLIVNNLDLKTNKNILIQSLNLNLKIGDRLIIYGANGCGKSTLMKALFHASHQFHTSISWNLASQDVQYVPQENPFHSSTPDYVIDFLVKSQNLNHPFKSTSSASQKAYQLLEYVHLTNKPLKTLSGGERQKLKIAQALLLNAKALILDEPFNGVDQTSQNQIYSLLSRIQPKTLQILVLHNLLDIRKMNSPVLWIENQKAQIMNAQDWFKKVDQQFHHSHCDHNEVPWTI